MPETIDAPMTELPAAARDRINNTTGVIGFTARTDRVAWKMPDSDIRHESQRLFVEIDTTAVDATADTAVFNAVQSIANDLGKLFNATSVYMARWTIENKTVTVV